MPTNPNMVAIQTVTVGSGGAASITFSNIPQTYTDLYILLSSRAVSNGDTHCSLKVSFNGTPSGTSYSNRWLYGAGSGVGSSSNTSQDAIRFIYAVNGSSATASTFGNASIYIPNYTGSNNKSASLDSVTENNATEALATLQAGLWANTSAITSVVLTPHYVSNETFAQYSTATLYGVTSSAYGAKATGGIITSDANYYYHTFLASGTFTPTSNITADYLVVAGGGGGGSGYSGQNNGAGGGAGGLRCTVGATGGGGSLESALSLTASTNYTVTVGAGGSAATQGSNSVFSSITSTGGGAGGQNLSGSVGNGGTGGSGGGGTASGGAGGTGGAGTTNQGYAGGAGQSVANYNAGGGGGAGEAGNTDGNGAGGDGVQITTLANATGTGANSGYYAGGGAGGSNSTCGDAGLGGGGAGGPNTNGSGSVGTANTGGGGGGGSGSGTGAAGGSGIVIVRYAK
jgi:hypothetical protein